MAIAKQKTNDLVNEKIFVLIRYSLIFRFDFTDQILIPSIFNHRPTWGYKSTFVH